MSVIRIHMVSIFTSPPKNFVAYMRWFFSEQQYFWGLEMVYFLKLLHIFVHLEPCLKPEIS